MKALIIANGALPSRSIVDQVLQSTDFIVCADGGANHAQTLNITPDVIIGDFDSILPSTRTFFKKVQQVLVEDQDSTDLEKTILYCLQHQVTSADVLGATGNRLDHTIGNLGCFKKFGDRIQLRFVEQSGSLSRIQGKLQLAMKKGEKLSLVPLDRCTGVTTRNLKYPLVDETLELGVREGTSNEAVADDVEISVETGTLLLYRLYESLP